MANKKYMATVYAFKGCPRDRGDLLLDNDIYGMYISCLQCGYVLSDREMSLLNDNSSNLEYKTQRHRDPSHAGQRI